MKLMFFIMLLSLTTNPTFASGGGNDGNLIQIDQIQNKHFCGGDMNYQINNHGGDTN